MLSKFIYMLFVKLFLRLGLYKARYVTYVGVMTYVAKLLRKAEEKFLCADLGCGPGIITKQLAWICDIVLGVDIESYDSWIRWSHPTLSFIIADARRIPIRSDALNVVTAISLLEHVPRWGKVIEEARRILKRYGLYPIIYLPTASLTQTLTLKLT